MCVFAGGFVRCEGGLAPKASKRMAQATLLVLLSVFTVIYGGNQRICGEQLADTLSLVCNGSFNKRSAGQNIKRSEVMADIHKRVDGGVVEECCFREQGCSWNTLQSYCAEPMLYEDYLYETSNNEEELTQAVPTESQRVVPVRSTPSTPSVNSRLGAAQRFLQVFRSGANRNVGHANRRPYWFFLPGLQLGQRATRRPYTASP